MCIRDRIADDVFCAAVNLHFCPFDIAGTIVIMNIISVRGNADDIIVLFQRSKVAPGEHIFAQNAAGFADSKQGAGGNQKRIFKSGHPVFNVF